MVRKALPNRDRIILLSSKYTYSSKQLPQARQISRNSVSSGHTYPDSDGTQLISFPTPRQTEDKEKPIIYLGLTFSTPWQTEDREKPIIYLGLTFSHIFNIWSLQCVKFGEY